MILCSHRKFHTFRIGFIQVTPDVLLLITVLEEGPVWFKWFALTSMTVGLSPESLMGEGLRNFFTYFYVTLSFLPENFNLLTYLLYFCCIRCIIKKAYLQDGKAFFFLSLTFLVFTSLQRKMPKSALECVLYCTFYCIAETKFCMETFYQVPYFSTHSWRTCKGGACQLNWKHTNKVKKLMGDICNFPIIFLVT